MHVDIELSSCRRAAVCLPLVLSALEGEGVSVPCSRQCPQGPACLAQVRGSVGVSLKLECG